MASDRHPYSITTPCSNCPFRTDVPPYLRPERVEEIEASLIRSGFPCHKTTKFGEEGERLQGRHEVNCAGSLILLEKLERPSQLMRIAERLGIYDARKLDMKAPVFDSFEEMIEAQEKASAKKRSAKKTSRRR